jgi:eukaryotic-like serine/threonine-protein kinase
VPNFYALNVNGTGPEEELFSSDSRKALTQWSRDGRFIVYSETNLKTREDLWVLPFDNGKAGKPISFLHSEFNEAYGQLSPDNRWMAYTSDASGRREVYERAFPSTEEPKRISINGGDQPRWRGDGKELYFIGADSKMMAAPIKIGGGPKPSLEPGPPQALFAAPPLFHYWGGNSTYDYDVTADGKRFLLNADVANATSTHALNVIVDWVAALKK